MKWKERVGIALAVSLILMTSVLVLDIRLAQIRSDHSDQPIDPMLVHLPVMHGLSRQKEGRQFQRRFLYRSQQNETPPVPNPPATAEAAAAAAIDTNIPANGGGGGGGTATNNRNNPDNNVEDAQDHAENGPNNKNNAKEENDGQSNNGDAVDIDVNEIQRDYGDRSKGQPSKGAVAVDTRSTDSGSSVQLESFTDLMVHVRGFNVDQPEPSGENVKNYYNITIESFATSWDKFHFGISKEAMYEEDDGTIDQLLDDMAFLPFINMTQKEGGTQLKLVIEYPNDGYAILKPMRYPREQQTLPNHFYFTDYERHNAEIAAFHLDRVLGFRRAPPVVGRLVNITTELYAFATGRLLKTFFISPAQNLCFHGECSYYCDTSHAICGSPDQLEVSLCAFLPDKSVVPRLTWRNPWRRSYHKRKKAQWEEDDSYCDYVRTQAPYNEGRRLHDLMDLSIFDFLTGNMDRHHYETVSLFGNDTFVIHFDQGRAFGRHGHDEMSILAPIYQCCMVRRTTLASLLNFHHGPQRLSSLMRQSLKRDPLDALNPILLDAHYDAMDRRVAIILRVIRHCLSRFPADQVLV